MIRGVVGPDNSDLKVAGVVLVGAGRDARDLVLEQPLRLLDDPARERHGCWVFFFI